MDWLGDFMHKFANDAADERKREAQERKMQHHAQHYEMQIQHYQHHKQ